MPDLATGISDFWDANHGWIAAALSILGAIGVAVLVDRALAHRGHRVAEAVLRGDLSPEIDTRLRFIRRLLYAVIILIGIAIAASQFTGVSKLATSLLASGAIAAAVIGFAARQTLANFVAGIMLAITQPLRVGDWVVFDDHQGVVEDVHLNYTILKTASDQRIVIPNDKLASGILRNDTLGSGSVGIDVQVWLPAGADVGRAVDVLAAATGQDVAVAEAVPWGVRLSVGGEPCPPGLRAAREAELRLRCLRRLQAAGLLAAGSPGGSGEYDGASYTHPERTHESHPAQQAAPSRPRRAS